MYSSGLITRMNNKIFSCVWTMDFMVGGGGGGGEERKLKLAQEYECQASMTFKFHTKKEGFGPGSTILVKTFADNDTRTMPNGVANI